MSPLGQGACFLLQNNHVVGVGSGSTVVYAVERLGALALLLCSSNLFSLASWIDCLGDDQTRLTHVCIKAFNDTPGSTSNKAYSPLARFYYDVFALSSISFWLA